MLERTGLDWTTHVEDASATMRAPLAGAGNTPPN
jgi:hypothetical protein